MSVTHPTVDRVSTTGIPPLGPYSRLIDGVRVDGRSREARFLRAYEARLLQHAGDTGSVTIRLMAQRAARLALHLQLMDERLLAGKAITSHDSRTYLAWSNGLVRLLKAMGLKSPPDSAKGPSLADIFGAQKDTAA